MYVSGHRQGFLTEKLVKYGLDEKTGGGLKTAGPRGWLPVMQHPAGNWCLAAPGQHLH